MRAAARQLDPQRVEELMREYRRSPERFFANYGGGPSIGYDLLDQKGRTYPPAAIVQAALGWKDIKGGLKHADSAGAALRANGFRVVKKGKFRSKRGVSDKDRIATKLRDILKTEEVRSRRVRVGSDVLRQFALLHHITCEISGIDDTSLLRVSHIIAWSKDAKLRLDPDNIVLLSSLWDAAFDRGLISFNDQGFAIFSSQLSKIAVKALQGSEQKALALNARRRMFLSEHRKAFGFSE